MSCEVGSLGEEEGAVISVACSKLALAGYLGLPEGEKVKTKSFLGTVR